MSVLYPLKDRIRYKLPYWLIEAYENVRDWLNPRQKWLTKKIPNHWIDKDTLWELCILEGIKHHVREDGGLDYFEEGQTDPNHPKHQKKYDRELNDIAIKAMVTLPNLEDALARAWAKIPTPSFEHGVINRLTNNSYEETYGEVDRLKKMISDLKTEIMVWAVKNRESIWT